jgi:DnaJ-class molecular chaperone
MTENVATSEETWREALTLLNISADASAEVMRNAYLQMLKQHPPDRDPEMFERIRNAYDLLRNPRNRARQVLLGPDPATPLPELFASQKEQRRFTGPELWTAVLKEKHS